MGGGSIAGCDGVAKNGRVRAGDWRGSRGPWLERRTFIFFNHTVAHSPAY